MGRSRSFTSKPMILEQRWLGWGLPKSRSIAGSGNESAISTGSTSLSRCRRLSRSSTRASSHRQQSQIDLEFPAHGSASGIRA